MARSATEAIAVGSSSWLLAGFGSDVGDDTSTPLTKVPLAEADTLTTRVICELSPTARPAAWVHTSPTHDRPGPDPRARVMPPGRVSVAVMGPAAFDGPPFDTVIVYVPSWPAVNGPAWDFTTDRSADSPIETVSVAVLLARFGSV